MALLLASGDGVWALHPHVPFAEVVHRADIIYTGTVTKLASRPGMVQGAIITDVTFQVTNLIHTKPTAIGAAGGEVTLTFAGGQLGDRGQSVSGVPTFELGGEYVVFSRFDGGSYINPLIGGAQGLFRVRQVPGTGEKYPLTLGMRGITARVSDELRFSGEVESLEANGVRFAPTRQAPAPTPAGESGDQQDAAHASEPATAERLLRLDEFIDEIQAVLRSPPPAVPALRGLGDTPEISPEFVPRSKRAEDKNEASDRPPPFSPREPLAPAETPPVDDVDLKVYRNSTAPPRDVPVFSWPSPVAEQDEVLAALCYCGSFNLYLTMEQVPTDWWEWGENNAAMFYYNQYMDIYRYVPDDGSWGSGGQNEFGGYPSSADLVGQYGQGWNGEIAVTWTSWTGCQCCQITQADVFFNPAYSFWQNFADTLDQPGRVLYRPNVMHELGHSWGMQRGSCTEDYSYGQVSVMHAYYSNVVEDGYGIHHPEAYSIRRLYQGQTGITSFTDIGVESYYASGSLINSTTDSSVYYAGASITLNNITVENNSYGAVAGVRLRFFLSTDKVITTSDTQMGSYWFWDSFPPETYSTAGYTTTVPNVPAGNYYVGAIVTRGGDAYAGDDFGANNYTFLHDPIAVVYAQPFNDYCSLGPVLPLGTTFGTTNGALTDGNASCGTSENTPDVWYTFEAPCNGTVRFDTLGSGYDTVLSVHSSCTGLTFNEVACNDDCVGTASCVFVPVDSSAFGHVRVSGYDGAVGDFQLNADYLAPANDMCQDADRVLEGEHPVASCGATTDGPDEPFACEFASYSHVESDVWYCYESSCPHAVIADVCGASYDTKLAVYDGCGCPSSASAIACNDDYCGPSGLNSLVTFRSAPGNSYLIRVGGYYGESGDGVLTIRCGCVLAEHCDDAAFCNGLEVCSDGQCGAGADPCAGRHCDEHLALCFDFGFGDFDGDFDVDLKDVAGFQNCYRQNGMASCAPLNLAGTLQIAEDDFNAFLLVFDGP